MRPHHRVRAIALIDQQLAAADSAPALAVRPGYDTSRHQTRAPASVSSTGLSAILASSHEEAQSDGDHLRWSDIADGDLQPGEPPAGKRLELPDVRLGPAPRAVDHDRERGTRPEFGACRRG